MGKKVKIGKTRKDKFYQLAKEAGYRSRAAFKLLQLNRTYHFLEKSRICVDLCAAPGGWLQVVATHMPMSSVIIGVDLAPIKPIANVITHCQDITTDKCRQLLKKDLNDNKADVFLHDGAPNVGKNWIHDAYQQNMLVLHSFKLATEFLKKGGWFITKVFRSKDYYSIMWVFQQFFKKVDSTKPQASRNESAEIFVVCQNYKAPDKIDPKFFDIKFVFSEVESSADTNKAIDLFKPPKRNRGGYPDGDMTLYHVLKASEFIQSENFIELLAKSNAIELDDDKIASHNATTPEIKELLKDLKLLGKTDLKTLLKWRLKVKIDLDEKVDKNGIKKEAVSETKEENEDEAIEDQIKEAVYNEKKLDKKKRKREEKVKKKLKEKLSLNMVYKDDILDHKSQGDNEIFSLNKIKTKKQLLDLQKAVPGLVFSDNEENDDELNVDINRKKPKVSFLRDEKTLDDDDEEDEEAETNDIELKESSDDDDDENAGIEESDSETNPLLNDLNGNKKETKTNAWFNKESFDFLNDVDEHNHELLGVLDDEDDENGTEKTKNDKKKQANGKPRANNENPFSSDGDDDVLEDSKLNGDSVAKFHDKKRKLSALELALGEAMVNSKKARRDLIDATYNRYSTFEDESSLPKWFVEDEEKHYKRDVAVSRQSLGEYRKRFDDINARPIKKVVEAQARKKRRMTKKVDRARKKAEVIADNADMSEKERSREMKQVYKKAGLLGKKKVEVKYVVAKKGVRGRVTAKSRGIKGPYRVVDPRLKKDKMRMRKNPKKRINTNKNKTRANKAKNKRNK